MFGLLSSDFALWREQRKIVAASFAPAAIDALVPAFARAARSAMASWAPESPLDMAEQSTASAQVTSAVENMRRQTEQASKALVEQARAIKDIHGAAQNTARQIKAITKANTEHSGGSSRLLSQLRDIQVITERNANSAKQTRGGTDDLLRHAEALASELQKTAQAARPNGRG